MEGTLSYIFWRNRIALVSLVLTLYFLFHMINGHHGWLAQQEMKITLQAMQQELKQLDQQKKQLENKVSLLKKENISRDFLEEKARKLLNFSYKNEKIIWWKHFKSKNKQSTPEKQ